MGGVTVGTGSDKVKSRRTAGILRDPLKFVTPNNTTDPRAVWVRSQ